VYWADEAFFTGTAAEVTPIRELDNRTIGAGSRGPITAKLQALFFDIVGGKTRNMPAGWITFDLAFDLAFDLVRENRRGYMKSEIRYIEVTAEALPLFCQRPTSPSGVPTPGGYSGGKSWARRAAPTAVQLTN